MTINRQLSIIAQNKKERRIWRNVPKEIKPIILDRLGDRVENVKIFKRVVQSEKRYAKKRGK